MGVRDVSLVGEDLFRTIVRSCYPGAGVWLVTSFYYMTRHVSEKISLDDLAMGAGVSKFHLCREFSEAMRMPPFQWLWRFRLLLARELLKLPLCWDIQQIAYRCGFVSAAHFSRAFKRAYGITPGKYRRMYLNEQLPLREIDCPKLDGLSCAVMRSAFEKLTREITKTRSRPSTQDLSFSLRSSLDT